MIFVKRSYGTSCQEITILLNCFLLLIADEIGGFHAR